MYDTVASILLFASSIIIGFQMGKYHRSILSTKKGKKIYKTETEKFLDLYELSDDVANSNINPDLYCYETTQTLHKNEVEDEKHWKKKILLENTAMGNIIMFYDLFKQAFAYYSDVQIPYKILNSCAMKYVRIFKCREFFLDSNIIPEGNNNIFHQLKNRETEEEEEKKNEKKNKIDIDFDSSVFISKNKKKKENYDQDEDIKRKKKISFINNFRYMGKIANFDAIHHENVDPINLNYEHLDFKTYKKKSIKTTILNLFS